MCGHVSHNAAGLTWYVGAAEGWTGGVGLGEGEGARALSSIFLCASSCSCFSLACLRSRSSSALFLSWSSFCLAMFSNRALMLPVLLPAANANVGLVTYETADADGWSRRPNTDQPPQVWSSGTTASASPPPQRFLRSVNQRRTY